VLNAYYALVAGYEDVHAKQSALELARTLYSNNRRQVELGAMTPLDVTTAEAQVASTSRDLVDSQVTIDQQELQLKNLMSRTGLADPELSHARIMPVDRIEIPAQDNLPTAQDLVAKALATRTDLAAQQANEKGAEISALGTRNGILPTAQVFGAESLAGLAGAPKTLSFDGFTLTPDSYFVGGMGTALGQIFRRNFPTQRIGGFVTAPLGNRQAQADFGIDQLQLRQTQLENLKNQNQVGVDVLNSVTAMRQARIRYDAAIKNRELSRQLLDAEQKKLSLGASVPYNVIQQQRDLTAAQSSVIAAEVSYSSAKVALDQTLGTILETNHVSIAEARSGRIDRASASPATP
jgi:outer membrane protein